VIYRLRAFSIGVIDADFKFADEHDVETRLWVNQSLVNNQFRNAIDRAKSTGQVVVQHKLERKYNKHLKTATEFYKRYIHELSLNYPLKQLQRIAQTLEPTLEQNETTVDKNRADLEEPLTKSCHHTLLHLGDLARYRMQYSKGKGQSPNTALLYYAMAHDILPASGLAHHQMAVVLAREDRHLDIVYHFYRAATAQTPHPIALKNLKEEFRVVLKESQPKPGSTSQTLLSYWFTHLHAMFFKGEAFKGQKEMEEEVLHRLETLLSDPGTLKLLLHTILINIAAYDLAKANIKSKSSHSPFE